VSSYVLDTSAILTLLNLETGHERVERILDQASGEPQLTLVFIPFMAFMETEYLVLRRHSEEDSQRYLALVLGWPAQVIESNPDWRHQAAVLKASGHLSVADAWVASLALTLEATLVHKDPEFDRVGSLQVLRLPS